MTIRTASDKDITFIADHEGFVSRAYYCPAGVLTIGYGFTMGSKVFAAWWRAKYGRALRVGDTITRADANHVLKKLVNEEYGKAVANAVQPKQQHHFGGATSMSFNCGTGALKWKWALALKAGDIKTAAANIRITATKANGRRLAGLVRRRKEEGDLVEFARYPRGAGTAVPAGTDSAGATVKQYQGWLKTLGYYNPPLKVDGVRGKGTIAAVKKFQQDHGLVVDGKVGSATISTLLRELDAKNASKAGKGAAGVGAGGVGVDASYFGDLPSLTTVAVAVGLVVLVVGGLWLYRNRGKLTGRRVPVA